MSRVAEVLEHGRKWLETEWRKPDIRTMQQLIDQGIDPKRLQERECPDCGNLIPYLEVVLYQQHTSWRPMEHRAPCGFTCRNGYWFGGAGGGGVPKFDDKTKDVHRGDAWCMECSPKCDDCGGYRWIEIDKWLRKEFEWIGEQDGSLCFGCVENWRKAKKEAEAKKKKPKKKRKKKTRSKEQEGNFKVPKPESPKAANGDPAVFRGHVSTGGTLHKGQQENLFEKTADNIKAKRAEMKRTGKPVVTASQKPKKKKRKPKGVSGKLMWK